MPISDRFYEKAVKRFKKAFKDIFEDDVILDEVYCRFSSRGYFKITYKYVPLNYSIIIENERRCFNIRIWDEEGAKNNLYGIEKYDGQLEYKNIKLAVCLLKKVLLENNFPLHICKEGKLYRKMDGKLEEIDISQI